MSLRPRWSRAEEDTIRLRAWKVTAAQIAKELGRSKNSVHMKIADLKKRGQLTRKTMTEDERIERMMWLSERCS